MAGKFYEKEQVIGSVTLPRGEELRLMVADKNGTKYIDIRTWYRDDADVLQPGKGLGKPASQVLPLLALVDTIGIDKLLETTDTWVFDGEEKKWKVQKDA